MVKGLPAQDFIDFGITCDAASGRRRRHDDDGNPS
jgi:hypothetical protein